MRFSQAEIISFVYILRMACFLVFCYVKGGNYDEVGFKCLICVFFSSLVLYEPFIQAIAINT